MEEELGVLAVLPPELRTQLRNLGDHIDQRDEFDNDSITMMRDRILPLRRWLSSALPLHPQTWAVQIELANRLRDFNRGLVEAEILRQDVERIRSQTANWFSDSALRLLRPTSILCWTTRDVEDIQLFLEHIATEWDYTPSIVVDFVTNPDQNPEIVAKYAEEHQFEVLELRQ